MSDFNHPVHPETPEELDKLENQGQPVEEPKPEEAEPVVPPAEVSEGPRFVPLGEFLKEEDGPETPQA